MSLMIDFMSAVVRVQGSVGMFVVYREKKRVQSQKPTNAIPTEIKP